MINQANEELATKRLPLSHMIYIDDDIDGSKAESLVVYHYPLSKSYKWKEWAKVLDEELSSSDRYTPYLMKSYKGQFGLFVALDDETVKPPQIYNSDGIEVHPLRVEYVQDMNPVWIRLIMRKVRAFGAHSSGSHTLGRPILKLDEWSRKKDNLAGINAISLDCRTQMLKNGGATEVVLFYENIPLREVPGQTIKPEVNKKSLWVYCKNRVLMRWIPEGGKKPAGVLYQEIYKSKNRRQQRSFLDVSSVKDFEGSWPYILKPIQDAFIEEATKYGFPLKPKVLNLHPLPLKTKYRSKADHTAFSSLNLDKDVDVLDLRVSDTVSGQAIVNLLQSLLDLKKIATRLNLLPPVKPEKEDVDKLKLKPGQRVLVLLDQTPGIVDDRYPLTKSLRTKIPCQHINVNPNDLASDSLKKGLLVERDGQLILESGSDYFDYNVDLFEKGKNRKALFRNLEIVIKELELKSLILNKNRKISETLPKQSEILNENLVVITDGCLFTVRQDRPVFIPFKPSDPETTRLCDRVLEIFNLSVAGLLGALQENWPYNYRPDVVMQGFGSPEEKLNKFANRLTFVINSNEYNTSVLLQDPKYETPHMLPEGLAEVREKISKQECRLPLKRWRLPDKEILLQSIDELEEEGTLTLTSRRKLIGDLDRLIGFWMLSMKELFSEGIDPCTYQEIKKRMFDKWLKQNNFQKPEKQQKSRADTKLISAWDVLLSRVLDLPLKDKKSWLKNIPGIHRLWYDKEQHYFIVGSLVSPQNKIVRQPSIRLWHCLQGQLNSDLITELVDVDWVRMNQLAGNPCVATLIKRWRECKGEEMTLGVELL